MKFISSRENGEFKRLRGLLDDARSRREAGSTLIDGDHLLRAALDAGWPLRQLVLREDVIDLPHVRALRAQAADVPCVAVGAALFRQLSPVVTPTGILAEIPFDGPVGGAGARDDVLALAGVQDAGNLGTLLRSAAAAGIREVWLDRHCTQAWSPKAMRAGMGAHFVLAIREGCALEELLAADPRQKLVTSLGERSVSLYAVDLAGPNLWIFGSEGQGVPEPLLALAERRVRIPMPGAMESLNVSAAAAICFFEQVRQRLATA
ncbi:MAG: RNA methyltransferase [Candidatus Dactylopiibacterium sp.]|nr:RNA methyltransferase [Candidatus Dactylopiibacterium sp.]